MGFMDKLKAGAADVAAEAKKAGAQAQEKAAEMAAKRKADAAAEKLGYLIHAERTGGAPAGAEADSLVAEITSLKAQAAGESQAPQDTPPAQDEPSDQSGDAAPAQSDPAQK
jgi:hypothetical protein